jgi:hypothetical protein
MISALSARILAFLVSISGFGAGFIVSKLCCEEKDEVRPFVSFFSEIFFAFFFSILSYFIFKNFFAGIVCAALSIGIALLIVSSKKALICSAAACALSLAIFFIFGNENAFFVIASSGFLFLAFAGSEFYFASCKIFKKKRLN